MNDNLRISRFGFSCLTLKKARMSKKGLSFEEKRQKLLSWFLESKCFFPLKEVEKLASKSKGLQPMMIKQLLQSLVDDDLVFCEKIGFSNFYWSFASAAIQSRVRNLEIVSDDLQVNDAKLASLLKRVEDFKSFQDADDDPTKIESMVQSVSEKKQVVNQLKRELAELSDFDLTNLNAKALDAIALKVEVNKWTDNIYATVSWMRNKNSAVTQEQILEHVGAPVDLDYIE